MDADRQVSKLLYILYLLVLMLLLFNGYACYVSLFAKTITCEYEKYILNYYSFACVASMLAALFVIILTLDERAILKCRNANASMSKQIILKFITCFYLIILSFFGFLLVHKQDYADRHLKLNDFTKNEKVFDFWGHGQYCSARILGRVVAR